MYYLLESVRFTEQAFGYDKKLHDNKGIGMGHRGVGGMRIHTMTERGFGNLLSRYVIQLVGNFEIEVNPYFQ